MSASWSQKLPEIASDNLRERSAINRLCEGKSDNHGTVNCVTATALTTVTTTYNCETACVILVPMNAAARTDYLAGNAYVSAVGAGNFSITHPSGSAERTYRYAWIG